MHSLASFEDVTPLSASVASTFRLYSAVYVREDQAGERVRVPSVLKEFQVEAESQRVSLCRGTGMASLVHPTAMHSKK